MATAAASGLRHLAACVDGSPVLTHGFGQLVRRALTTASREAGDGAVQHSKQAPPASVAARPDHDGRSAKKPAGLAGPVQPTAEPIAAATSGPPARTDSASPSADDAKQRLLQRLQAIQQRRTEGHGEQSVASTQPTAARAGQPAEPATMGMHTEQSSAAARAAQQWQHDPRTYTSALAARGTTAGELREGTFEDIGTSQQLQWFERSVAEPLVHAATSTTIFVHSVCAYHPASLETARNLINLVRPSALAVCINHDAQESLQRDLDAHRRTARDKDHVKRIADGYHRVVQGQRQVSELNPTDAALEQSYQEGRAIARQYGIYDPENWLEELAQAEPQLLEQEKAAMAQQPALLEPGLWHAMFLSGMRPTEVYDAIMQEALAAQRGVHFIDPSGDALQQFAEQFRLPEDEATAQRDMAEMQTYQHLIAEVGQRVLPPNTPPALLGVMAPAALYPDQAERVLQQMQQQTPVLFDFGMFRAACNARTLEALCTQADTLKSKPERHLVVLCDRLQEDCLRSTWQQVMERSVADLADGSAGDQPVVRPMVDQVQLSIAGSRTPSKAKRRRRK